MWTTALFLLSSSAVSAISGDYGWTALNKIRPSSTAAEQSEAVLALIERLLPGRRAEFSVVIDPGIGLPFRDTFELSTNVTDGRLVIVGTTGAAAALGLNYYLQSFCSCSVTWAGRQLAVPFPLPPVLKAVKVQTNDRFFYYQNVCTASYTSVWWNWTRWEQEIDWMALNGINLPLAFTGQEMIWKRAYLSLGVNETDIDNWLSGPAFLAWWRMGNLKTWGGPPPAGWLSGQLVLQHQILQRMRSFGMTPVLPAFAGHVPDAIKRVFPEANVTQLGDWNKFNCSLSCTYFLDPSDPLFQKIGEAFLTQLIKEYGSDHLYNSDPFNEELPARSDLNYVASVSAAIYKSIITTDPDGIWVLQGWMFRYNPNFWQPAQAKAFLTSVPPGRMVVLDLQAEAAPVFGSLESYYGQPFIWCFLHNFGGNLGLYGSAGSASEGPYKGRLFPNSTMIGTGLTMEGTQQNEYLYELMSQTHWLPGSINLTEWTEKFAIRRYGVRSEKAINAWLILATSVYAPSEPQPPHEHYIITQRPSLNMTSNIHYSGAALLTAWELILASILTEEGTYLTKSRLFRYDLVDLTREVFVAAFDSMLPIIRSSYELRNGTALRSMAALADAMLTDLDSLLAADNHFLLGIWLQEAKQSAASDPDQSWLFEYNARNQVTLWGPGGNILDYASKQWSGLVEDYYKQRWLMFLDALITSIEMNVPFNRTAFDVKVFQEVELPFSLDQTTVYPAHESGDAIKTSLEMYRRYRDVFQQLLAIRS